jgi:hypothetical protein
VLPVAVRAEKPRMEINDQYRPKSQEDMWQGGKW